MIIREATIDEVFSIAKVHVDSNRTTYKGIMPDIYLNNLSYESKASKWKERLFHENSNEFMYVAETSNKKIIGFVSASLVRTNKMFERELFAIYILKEFQGKGIGMQLIKAVIRKYISNNINSMVLWTLKDNSSRLFYERLGGKIVDNNMIERGGQKLEIIAYGWEDIRVIIQ